MNSGKMKPTESESNLEVSEVGTRKSITRAEVILTFHVSSRGEIRSSARAFLKLACSSAHTAGRSGNRPQRWTGPGFHEREFWKCSSATNGNSCSKKPPSGQCRSVFAKHDVRYATLPGRCRVRPSRKREGDFSKFAARDSATALPSRSVEFLAKFSLWCNSGHESKHWFDYVFLTDRTQVICFD